MEIVLLVGVAAFVAYYFLVYKKQPEKKVEDATYKLEAPAAPVAPVQLEVAEKAANNQVEAAVPVVTAPAKKRVTKPKVVTKKAEPKPKPKTRTASKTTKIQRTK